MIRLNTYLVIMALIAACFLSSCDSDDENPQYSVPDTYSFQDEAGNSTVNYSGQAARLAQLDELVAYIETANTPGVALDEAKLLEMYSNNNGVGSEYFSQEAAAPGKQLKDKTARGDATIQAIYENYLKSVAAISANTTTGEYSAANGSPGVAQSGTRSKLFNAIGLEYAELVEKGLMGAVFYDQIQNVYLGESKLDVDNSGPVDAAAGKYYTTMEHHWDEAFGYFTTATDFPANDNKRFWGKYSNVVDPALSTNSTLMEAFIKGRAAISNDDYDTRDEQVEIIRTELEKVAAATAIHYLNTSVTNFSDDMLRNHQLSEALGFIEALYFTHPSTAVMDAAEIDQVLALLQNENDVYNLYDVTVADLQAARDLIASHYGFGSMKDTL